MADRKNLVTVFALTFGYSFLGIGGLAVLLWLLLIPIFFSGHLSFRALANLELIAFLALLGLAIASTITLSPYEFNAYFIGRDLFYFLSAILAMLVGYFLAQSTATLERLIWPFCIVLFVFSAILFVPAFLAGDAASFSLEARYAHSLNSNLAILAFLLFIGSMRTNIKIGPKRLRYAVFALVTLFVVASLSRVNVAILVVALLVIPLRWKTMSYIAIGGTVFCLVLPFVSGSLGLSNSLFQESTSFLDKIVNSISEIAVGNHFDASARNLHWRGYEAYLGVAAVSANGWLSVLTGLGLGSYVEGPFIDKLNVIPIFHNGYVTIYLKGGVVGLMLYVYFMFRQVFPSSGQGKVQLSAADQARLLYLRRLAALMVISLAIRTMSTHGILFPSPPLELLVLGIIHGARHCILKKAMTSSRAFTAPLVFASAEPKKAAVSAQGPAMT